MTKNVTQDTVITSWLEAESNSPRFTSQLTEHAEGRALKQIISGSDATARMDLLVAARGRQVSNFPWEKVTWRMLTITNKEALGNIRTCPGLSWLAFTAGDRLISTAASWISKQPLALDPRTHVAGVHAKIAKGEPLPPVIAYRAENGSTVLLEGHVRAVSYYLSNTTPYPLSIFFGIAETPEDFKKYDSGLNLPEIRELFLKEDS